MTWLRMAGSVAFAATVVVAVACNSGGPCPQAGGNWGSCDCTYSGANEWSCNETNVPACPNDAVGALTANVACSYHGPTCVYCDATSSGAAGAAVWCSCDSGGGSADAGGKTFWDCSLRNGYTCDGP